MKAVTAISFILLSFNLHAQQFEIQQNKDGFSNPFITISQADTVRFVSSDNHQHYLTTHTKLSDIEQGYLNPGSEIVLSFSEPGVVEVKCKKHKHAPMTIFVRPSVSSAAAF